MGSGTVVTSGDGTARYTFPANQSEEGYYTAEVTTTDGNGRSMNYNVWIYKGSSMDRIYPQTYEYFWLKSDKESYKAGEEVNVQIVNNMEEPLADMRTLFVEARNGIQKYKMNNKTSLSTIFPEDYAPNFTMYAVAFNGKTYIRTNKTIMYDYSEKKLLLEIKTDKDSYKPGDNMTISLAAKDINGNPVAAKVNISLVDGTVKAPGQYRSLTYSWIGTDVALDHP